jgi:hypothetical protein
MNNQPAFTGAELAVVLTVYAVFIVFFGWMYVRIIRKAGYSGWWVLMALVPIGNLVMLAFFAFKEWPVRRELEYLRGYAAATGLPGYTPQPPPPAPPWQQGQLGQPWQPWPPNQPWQQEPPGQPGQQDPSGPVAPA